MLDNASQHEAIYKGLEQIHYTGAPGRLHRLGTHIHIAGMWRIRLLLFSQRHPCRQGRAKIRPLGGRQVVNKAAFKKGNRELPARRIAFGLHARAQL